MDHRPHAGPRQVPIGPKFILPLTHYDDRPGDLETELGRLAQTARETSLPGSAPPDPPSPAIAKATAAGINGAAERIIADIEERRTEARKQWEAFDGAASETQALIREMTAKIAKQAESYISALAGSALTVRKIGNDVATFGNGA